VTFDYRCPFARNAHEAVVTGLREGRDWDVRFVPFSLDQVHVEEGEPPVWEREPDAWGTGVLALLWGIAVRDSFADRFFDWHVAAFSARHDEGQKIAHESVMREVTAKVGLDADAVGAEVASGGPLEKLAAEHTEAVKRWDVFGVPTFIVDDRAVFLRVMERDHPDDVDRTLDLLGWRELNEFKLTRIPR
jgi:hypothetical protein